MTKSFLTFLLLCLTSTVFSQNNRLNTHEKIGWYNFFGTFKVAPKISLHGEYQWRREDFIANWQQGLARVGVNYQPNSRITFRVGYAWAETYPYGEIPINGMGKDFTEHRIYEMVQLTHKEYAIDFSHRFMLEQRFVGRYNSVNSTTEDEYPLLHRMRYMFRMNIPLKGTEIKDKTPYIAVYDEVFIGFGSNVNANVFDQNRVGVLLGYRFNPTLRLEAGFLNQTIQFGRQINGQNIFQNNNGFIINANFNFDLTKKEI